MSRILLSIIISTYNRAELFQKNATKMLKCKLDNIEFIIGDNASQDNTYECMKKIEDPRVTIFHNTINIGFENFWVLSASAKGKYFMFVNDRDYIDTADIKKLCQLLRQINDVDFISNEKRDYNPGYYEWKDALNIYFQSRHPGTLVYNNAFCKKNINTEKIKNYLLQNKPEKANNYLVLMILFNVKKVYVNSRNMINQPLNRERIVKVRKEYYEGCYVSLEYRMKEYDDWIIACKEYRTHPRIKKIMLSIYKDSLMTVTWEYYMSLKIPGFKQRTKMEENSVNEWIENGILFSLHIMKNPIMKDFGLRRDILHLTVLGYKETIRKVLES